MLVCLLVFRRSTRHNNNDNDNNDDNNNNDNSTYNFTMLPVSGYFMALSPFRIGLGSMMFFLLLIETISMISLRN